MFIIQKALGRENIDEVMKLSDEYKDSEKSDSKTISFIPHYTLSFEGKDNLVLS